MERHTVGRMVCRVSTHGMYQVELDLQYAVQDQVNRDLHSFDLYFLFPYHLGINEEQCPSRQFFRNVKSYARILPASVPFAHIADPQCACSPLTRIRRALEGNPLARTIPEDEISYELRMLVNMHHGEFRGLRQLIQLLLKDDASDEDIQTRLAQILRDHDVFIEAFRQLPALFSDTRISGQLREALAWAEEAISIKTGRELHKLRLLCQRREGLRGLVQELVARCGSEQAFRASRHFATVIDPADPITGELFLYREGLLKKWAQSSTYLSVARSRKNARIAHVLAGVAAAIAMVFAVAAMFLAECLFVSYSLPWAILIVVSYMFKDRIKEILRGVLLQWQPRLIADEICRLIDPRTGEKIGSTLSRARYVDRSMIPDYVRQMRYSSRDQLQQILPPESVLHFHNELRMFNQRLLSSHSRLTGVGALFRIRIEPWLRYMDDPSNRIYFVSSQEPHSLDANRVYHINMVVRICRDADDASEQFFHARLIVNRNGILRIEQTV